MPGDNSTNTSPANTTGASGGAIIPSGSQLNDPIAAGQAAMSDGMDNAKKPNEVDPFNNPNWLATDEEFNRKPPMDADPNTPGVDVFGGNISDLPQDITIPVATPVPPAEVPVEQAPVVPDAVSAHEPAAMPEQAEVPEPAITPVTVAPEQLAVAATTEEPKAKALNKLVDQVIAPKTRRNINLIIVFILLILVFLLASATVFLMLRGPVNVTINTAKSGTGQSTSLTTTSSTSTSVTTTSATTLTPESIYAYMVLLSSDRPGEQIELKDLPEGSVKLSNGYLVKVLLDENVSTNDSVKEALTKLLEIKDATYGDEEYRNYLSRADLSVETTKEDSDDAEWEVNLVGDFTVAQSSDIAYAKQQIERTIENYTLNYRVMLNGSESEYACLGSSDVNCR